MHEMSICEGVLQVMKDEARMQSFRRVKAVWLEIGELAGVEIDALRFGFDVVCRGSLAEGAELHIVRTPGRGRCTVCRESVVIGALFEPCPFCGSHQVQVTGGSEMRIKELEVE